MKFNLYKDSKSTIWRRDYFRIEADSIEEAINQILNLDAYPIDSELLMDTEEGMLPSENGGQATEEIFDTYTNETLYGNQQN